MRLRPLLQVPPVSGQTHADLCGKVVLLLRHLRCPIHSKAERQAAQNRHPFQWGTVKTIVISKNKAVEEKVGFFVQAPIDSDWYFFFSCLCVFWWAATEGCWFVGNFSCPNCYKPYVKFQSLQKHIKVDCGKSKRFSCGFQFCNYRSNRKENTKRHMALVHGLMDIARKDCGGFKLANV